MKVATIFTVLTALFLFAAGSVLAAEKGKPQTRCPLMGGEINKEVFVDHEGQRIYFCCPGCIPKFKEDPAGYIKKLEDQGITVENTPGLERHLRGASEGEKHQHQH